MRGLIERKKDREDESSISTRKNVSLKKTNNNANNKRNKISKKDQQANKRFVDPYCSITSISSWFPPSFAYYFFLPMEFQVNRARFPTAGAPQR